MGIKTLVLGYLDNNCYILTINNQSIIIDPAACGDIILKELGKNELLGILITHRHPDHIGALDYILEKTKTKVYDLEEGFHTIGPFNIQVIETKGHTEDSKTFLINDIMFSGDFIFKDTIGRTDLKGGNMKEMLKSIEKIKKFKDCRIMPGHGEETTLNYEKENNGFFNM